ncbi:TonB-dependent receptor [Solimonas terrae]|uniref:TonB-dependent receptor n=1 Tax=Solimonas terrae TaxID=1396819 RepID=A0A6M2BSM9_9GAMM|nr:TonB-dependent receptor [Solimonas terrae]NGY05596.1 TonB-dependent receptor [Solimonas terrae]
MRHQQVGNPRQRCGAVAAVVVALGLSVCVCARADDAQGPQEQSPAIAQAGPATPSDSNVAAPAQAPDASAGQVTNSSRAEIPEVIVTATKRKQSLRDIPASITSIPGEELAQRNAQNMQDIVKLVPGVNYTQDAVTPGHITVRGISAAPSTGFTTGVLFGDVSFIDEYIPVSALDPNPFDLQSVDVLKGPQGTLFGASALNGAIRYVPEPPHFDQWQFNYYASYSRYVDSDWKPNIGAVVNVPIGDTLALRFMGFDRHAPGWINNTRTGVDAANRTDQDGTRAILGWQPQDDIDVKLTYAWQNTHVADTAVATDANLDNTVNPRASPTHVGYSLADLNAGFNLGFARLVSDTAYVHKRSYLYSEESNRLEGLAPDIIPDGSIPLIALVVNAHSNTISQEFRLVSPDDKDSPWRWVAGVFGSRQHAVTSLDTPIGDASIPFGDLLPLIQQFFPQITGGEAQGGIVNGEHSAVDAEVRELALFADVTRRLWKEVELSLGGRLYNTKSSGNGVAYGPLVIASVAENQQVVEKRSGAVGETGFNPKVSLSWHVTPEFMAYVAASKGFRVGGLQTGSTLPGEAAPPPVFKSDSIWNYESGVRTEWFHRTLRFDVTGFYERWSDPQYQEFDNLGLNSFMTNVGGVKSVGAEAALQVLLPVRGLMFSVSGSYADTVTTKPFDNPDGSTAPAGTPWPFAPHWQTATTLAYTRDIGDWSVYGAATHTYLGKAVNNLQQQLPIFGYQQWDANVSLDSKSWRWMPELTLTVSNLLDERGLVNHNVSAGANPFDDLTFIQPRQISLRLSGHF